VLKKTITYEDFNGEEVSEDFFFHLSKAELIELEMSQEGGLSQWLQNVIAAEDGKSIMAEFKKIVLGSYGKRSPDGKIFVKNQELRDEFESTEAYSALFVELVTNVDAAIEFVNGVIPKNMAEDAAKVVALSAVPEESKPDEEKPEEETEVEYLTKAQVVAMPTGEYALLSDRIATGKIKLID